MMMKKEGGNNKEREQPGYLYMSPLHTRGRDQVDNVRKEVQLETTAKGETGEIQQKLYELSRTPA